MSQLPNRVPAPTWWQLLTWIADPIKFQDRYHQRYGDIFTMNLGRLGGYVVIGEPKLIQEIFSQDSKFEIGRGNVLAQPLIGRNSLMLMDGDRHKRERKLLMPSFHGERLQAYATQICAIADQIASQWHVGQPFVVRSTMQKISLELILQVVFGLSEGERYQQLKPLLTEWLDMTDSPLRSSLLFLKFLQKDWGAWSPWSQMKQRQRQVHQLLQDEISDRKNQGDAGRIDVLSLMMAARDEQGNAMTDEELRDELITLLFAGHETVATSLSWAFYEIHRQPHILEKLLVELESFGATPSVGAIAPQEDLLRIAQLPYLSAVCQETLRMYPVLPVIFPRITKAPVTLAGRSFDAETVLMPSIYLVHYREDLYPHPHEFKPERFLERQYAPSEYFPFGGGVRRCLGYALAQLEMKLVLATVVSRYRLELLETKPVKMQRRGFTLAPKGGVRMAIIGKR
ncbi:cytochrome P450 [Oscillatoria sp. FACHB-1407]|uniref:cytochrome P450 n=1 Tax=Oscillatoria sp. FACHB-1407 TaxID=2692847 RepID=UPI001685E462|nr:cytochrome P450 [Oscillatoria sp. FACHB-1407]MBD2461096.1 cytochrome P450 [Oscillatoria sp. FACHB-1407]